MSLSDIEVEDDIAADIMAAMQGEPEAPQETPEAAQPEPENPAGPARDEHGRFAPKEGVEKPTEQVEITAQPEGQAEPQPGTIRPPSSWSAAAKADFAQLPQHIQAEVLKREQDIENGKAQWDQKGERLNRFDGLFAPIKDRLTIAGIDEFSYIQALIRADDMLRNPATQAQAFQMIAQQYGVNLPAAQHPQMQPQVQQPNPEFQALQQQVQTLLSSQEESRKAEVTSKIDAFRKDHIYFENVEADMAALAQATGERDLQKLYDRACWARDDIRPLLLAEQAKSKQPPAQETRKAGLQPTGAPGQTQQQKAPGDPDASIEDDIRAAYKEVLGVV